METIGKDGEVELEWLCSPLAVVASGRNVQHASWSRCIEFVNPEDVVRRRYVLEKDLTFGFNKVLADLCDQGLKIARGTPARRQLNELIAGWTPVGRYESIGRLGWADATCKAFVLGDKRVVGKANTVFLNPVVRTRKHKVTTDNDHMFNIAPNLLDRDFNDDAPNQKWAGDLSYIWA